MKQKKFFLVIILIQMFFLLIVGLSGIGLKIPLIQQIVGFIFLMFIPGLVLIRILNLNELDITSTFLYSVGLSIFFLMLIGLILNTFFPLFGILKPITTNNVLIIINIGMICLYLIYIIKEKFTKREYIYKFDLKKTDFNNKILFLILIPFLSIFGTYYFNNYNNDLLLLALIAILAIMPILVVYDKIPKRYLPLTIFIISISILFHSSLISNYIIGMDIHHEYFLQKLVSINSIWNPNRYGSYNVMLSTTLIPNLYSLILNIPGVWVLKIIYPFIFALVPLGLYKLFNKLFDPKISFLAVFFFISFSTFFTDMLSMPRQEMAEFFLVLLILIIFSKEIAKIKKSMLIIIFAISLIFSHYSLTYFFIVFMLMILFTPYVLSSLSYLVKLPKFVKEQINLNLNLNMEKRDIAISSTFILLITVFTITWYLYLSNASTISDVITVGQRIFEGVFNEFFNAGTRENSVLIAIGQANLKFSLQRTIFKELQYLSELFIIIGFFSILLSKKYKNFDQNYLIIIITSLLLLLLSIVLPNFSNSLNMFRIYHIALLFLAPLCIIGCIEAIKLLMKPLKKFKAVKFGKEIIMPIVTIFVVTYFLFNTGFIYEISGDEMPTDSFRNYDFPRYNLEEITGASWLENHLDKNIYKYNYVYADVYRSLLLGDYNWYGNLVFPNKLTKMKETKNDYYLYFGTRNLKGKILVSNSSSVNKQLIYINYSSIIQNREKIYDNGGSTIWK